MLISACLIFGQRAVVTKHLISRGSDTDAAHRDFNANVRSQEMEIQVIHGQAVKHSSRNTYEVFRQM
jgi:hypothetical protein